MKNRQPSADSGITVSPVQDANFMQQALALALEAAEQGEVPVGAILVENGKVIGQGANAPISNSDCTAHAEILAIRQASQAKSNYRLPNTTLYLTLEPCSMCAGAMVHARIKRVVIAAAEPRAGAAGSVLNILQNTNYNHQCEVEFGLMAQQSSELLKSFFRARR